jgi:hypothetical protein
MSRDELEHLSNADEWDFENAERQPGAKNPRAVVSVAFGRRDFERVSECAERSKKRTSEFIREAALEKVAASQNQEALAAFTASGSAVLFTHTPLSTTRLSGSAVQFKEKEDAITA